LANLYTGLANLSSQYDGLLHTLLHSDISPQQYPAFIRKEKGRGQHSPSLLYDNIPHVWISKNNAEPR